MCVLALLCEIRIRHLNQILEILQRLQFQDRFAMNDQRYYKMHAPFMNNSHISLTVSSDTIIVLPIIIRIRKAA